MIRVALFGASGRMGRAVVQALQAEADIELAHAVEAPGREGIDLGGIVTETDQPGTSRDVDLFVDVSIAEGTVAHAKMADKAGIPILIGTTGFTEEQLSELDKLQVAHIIAPNLSIGINMLFEMAPRIRKILGDRYDVGIVDTHHRHKLDAPSGTANKLAAKLNEVGPEVQVVSLRIGEVVGEHRITFAVDGEQIELIHRAESRMALARGVPPAVRFLAGKKSGRYSMADVLGLSDGKDRS